VGGGKEMYKKTVALLKSGCLGKLRGESPEACFGRAMRRGGVRNRPLNKSIMSFGSRLRRPYFRGSRKNVRPHEVGI